MCHWSVGEEDTCLLGGIIEEGGKGKHCLSLEGGGREKRTKERH